MKNTLVYLVTASVSMGCLFAQGFSENFEKAADGSALGSHSLVGWHQDGNASEKGGFYTGEAAYSSGRGLRLAERETFAVFQTEKPFWTKIDGAASFSMTFRFTGKMPIDICLHNGSTSFGFYISINNRKGELVLSQGGGESAFRGDTAVHSLAGLEEGVWYTLEIRDINLDADPASGKVYLYEASSPSNLLVDGLNIVASGNPALAGLRTFVVRRFGSTTDLLDIDDVSVKAATAQ